jgi:ribosome maturation factor RimP
MSAVPGRLARAQRGYTRRGTFFAPNCVSKGGRARLFGPMNGYRDGCRASATTEPSSHGFAIRAGRRAALPGAACRAPAAGDRQADGVDIALCERVTGALRDLLEEWSLEVSSPGPERPLTKPEHFRRFLGNRVRVKTSEEIAGRHSFTGTLTAADEERVSLDAPDGAVTIPLQSVRRSNLVPEEVA